MYNKFPQTKSVKKKTLKKNHKRIKKWTKKNDINGPSVNNKNIFFSEKKGKEKKLKKH